VTRTFREQVDAGIVDRAAALFARRGFAKTSVQDVADAVGLSKTGLLHHFPTKDALREAVLAQSTGLGRQVVDQVQHLPVGETRDRRALEALTDLALAHPGMVAMLLSPLLSGAEDDGGAIANASADALRAFGVEPGDCDTERVVRVIGALAALAVLTLAADQHDRTTTWRPFVLATCHDALGHRRPSADPSVPDQVEA
jgi:AcrR family transcriptional regulator